MTSARTPRPPAHDARTAGAAQRGQTLIVFAIVLALVLVGMLGLVADLGAVFTTYTQADNAALLAAQSGAAAIDTQKLYGAHPQIVLDQRTARANCSDVLRPLTPTFQCDVRGARRIDADVEMRPKLPLPFWPVSPVRVTRTAYAVYGGQQGTPP
jgi:hypothetical protein